MMWENQLQFSNPSISHIIFNVNREFKTIMDPIKMENNYQTSVEKSLSDRKAVVELFIKIGDRELAPFYMELKMGAVFNWTEGLDESIDSLLATKAPNLLMSYARPVVASITNQSKFPVYNLPFCDFSQNAK